MIFALSHQSALPATYLAWAGYCCPTRSLAFATLLARRLAGNIGGVT